MATLVLGLGNPILTDDGVGIYVVREIASRLTRQAPHLDIDVAEASVGGLRLLDTLAGYRRAILVDAIQTPDGEPGTIYRLHPTDLRQSLHAGSSHDLSLPDALALGRSLDMELPADKAFIVFAIEVQDVLSFGEECTPAAAKAIPEVVDMVHKEILAG